MECDQKYVSVFTKVPFILFSDFNETRILSTDFFKNTQISNFMKSRPVGAELFDADGRTDMAKLIVAFRNCANAPEELCIQL